MEDAMNRRQFLSSIPATAFAAGKRPPNIIWIMGDDLGYSDLGCYGQKIIQTPHIDRLATQGTRCTDAYSGCTVCAPSRSVLMTGRHMGHTTVRSNPGGVPIHAEDVTIAQVLKQAGYATGCFGKWGIGDIGTPGVPWLHGFDDFTGYLSQVHAHFYYPPYLWKNDQKIYFPENKGGLSGTYSHDVIAQHALDFVGRNKSNPFFCYMPVTLPHWELLVPEDSMAPYRGKVQEAAEPFIDKANHYATQKEPRAAYAGMVSRLDRSVGRVMDRLKELNIENETLLIFTSDNGGALRLRNDDYFKSYGPFRGNKQNFYEGGIRVPMIVRWPGKVPSGRVSDFPWMFQDALPTLADVAGVKPPRNIDGMSVLPALLGKKQKPHDFLYWEQPRHNAKTGEFLRETPMQAVRMGDWKAVRPKPGGPLELYNLKTDIGETTDVAASNPAVLKKIEDYLKTARTEPTRQTQPEHDWWGPPKW